MSSPGQRRGTCDHAMASFDSHLACAHCRDKGKGKDPCVEKPDIECTICSSFSPEQHLQLATPSYQIKKDKQEAKKLESSPPKDMESLVDPSAVTVLGAVDKQGAVKSSPSVAPPPPPPPEKKVKKDKTSTSKSVKSTTSSSTVDSKLAQLDGKWSDRFNRLEALLLARSIEPTFSSAVKVTPTHSPPASTSNTTEPFIRPVQPTTEFTGTGFSATQHQPASQTEINRPTTTSMLPGTGFSAVKHQPTSKAKSSQPTAHTQLPGTGSSAAKHQPTSKAQAVRQSSDRPAVADRPLSSEPADTGSPALHRSRQDSTSSLSSEAGSMLSDNPPLDLYTEEGELSEDQDHPVTDVSSWNTDASKLNSSYSRIAKYTGLSSTPPASRRITQETLRRWERSARETSVICNLAASFNRCLFKVQQNMKDQLKVLKAENKGKGSSKASAAAEELTYLMDFNSSITQAAAKSMEHLSEFIFITMGNLTLVRRDAYLSHLRTGIKPDHISTLFPDSVIKWAEEDIAQLESKGHAGGSHAKGRYHPYERQDKRSVNRDSRSEKPAWKNIGRKQFKRGRGRTTTFSSRPAKGQQSFK